MAKLSIDDLKKIKEKGPFLKRLCGKVHQRVKVTVHMGTCGIASGAKEVMDSLMNELSESGVLRTSPSRRRGLHGGSAAGKPLVTVEVPRPGTHQNTNT